MGWYRLRLASLLYFSVFLSLVLVFYFSIAWIVCTQSMYTNVVRKLTVRAGYVMPLFSTGIEMFKAMPFFPTGTKMCKASQFWLAWNFLGVDRKAKWLREAQLWKLVRGWPRRKPVDRKASLGRKCLCSNCLLRN